MQKTKRYFLIMLAMVFMVSMLTAVTTPAKASSDDWIDPATGHRIIRLSRLPGSSSIFYYHQNAFTSDGKKMVFANAHSGTRYLYSVDLSTLETRQIMVNSGGSSLDVVAPLHNEVITVMSDGTVEAVNIDTSVQRTIATLPPDWYGLTVNADETMLAGEVNEGLTDAQNACAGNPDRNCWISGYFNEFNPSNPNRPHNAIFTINLNTGQMDQVYQTDLYWIDHVQFSPTDPNEILFEHEAPATLADATPWVINIAPGNRTPVALHTITNLDFVTHAFWNTGGDSGVYDFEPLIHPNDLSTMPRDFYIAKTNINTLANTLYPIASTDWSLHYNVSPDGSLIAGDGGYNTVTSWGQTFGTKSIKLYRHGSGNTLQVEALADMSLNDYNAIEPNVHFTPDSKWVVYRSNQSGSSQVYAVEVGFDMTGPGCPKRVKC